MRSLLTTSSVRRHASRLAALVRGPRGLTGHEGGIAAVEFALILPIMVLLWIGGVEVTSALSVDRRINNLASSMGDLVARSRKVKESEMTDIFKIAKGVMYPMPVSEANKVAMRITAVKIGTDKTATTTWTRNLDNSASPGATPPVPSCLPTTAVNAAVPAELKNTPGQVIMAEACYRYVPAVGYVIKNSVTLTDRMFFVPRLVAAVQICDNDGNNCT